MIPRKDIATFGSHGSTVRVFIEKGGGIIRVQWRENGRLRSKSWPKTGPNKQVAKAWAENFSKGRETPSPASKRLLTLREMWELYKTAEFPHLRTKTIQNYTNRWGNWENFAGKNFVAELTTQEMLDQYRAERTNLGLAVSQTKEHFKVIKLVYAWALRRELITTSRVTLYRFKMAKEDRTKPPAEYAPSDYPKIISQLDPKNGREWRAWCALSICGTQGARVNAVLHLRWEDVDFENKTIHWRPEWDKVGQDRRQPLSAEAIDALYVALGWSQRDPIQSGWVFYTPTQKKRERGDETYGVQALWRMLRNAEDRAGVEHKARRAVHGLRKMSARNALEITKDPLKAMQWIGDSDPRQIKTYLQEREDSMQNIAENLPKQEIQTVTKPQPRSKTQNAPESTDALSVRETTTYDE